MVFNKKKKKHSIAINYSNYIKDNVCILFKTLTIVNNNKRVSTDVGQIWYSSVVKRSIA